MQKITMIICLGLFSIGRANAVEPKEIMNFFTSIAGEYNDFKNCDETYEMVIYPVTGGGDIIDPFGQEYLHYTIGNMSAGYHGDFRIEFKRVRLTENGLSYRLQWKENIFRPPHKKDIAFHVDEYGELERFTMKHKVNGKTIEVIDCSR